MDRSDAIARLYQAYARWYDIQETGAEPLIATAAFHEHGTGYLLVKKAEMWSADRHEYAYFYSVPHLTGALYASFLEEAQTLGNALIHPEKGHMSSYIVCIVVCDTAEQDALDAAKSCRIKKSFQFSLKGWMEVHTAVVETGKESITANSLGRNTAKFLKSTLYPKGKQGFFFRKR